jgi:hypothetical protein
MNPGQSQGQAQCSRLLFLNAPGGASGKTTETLAGSPEVCHNNRVNHILTIRFARLAVRSEPKLDSGDLLDARRLSRERTGRK